MVNFSLFSDRGKEVFADIVAEKRGITRDEATEFLIAEEKKRPSRTVKLQSAKLEEERKALATLQKNNPKVFADVQKKKKEIVIDAENIGKSFTVQLTEKLKLNDGKIEDSIHTQTNDGVQKITFGSGATNSLFTGATFALVDKFLKEVFGNVRKVVFNPETQKLIDEQKKIIADLEPKLEAMKERLKKKQTNSNTKKSKSEQIAARREQIADSKKIAEIAIPLQKARDTVKRLQEENTILTKITEAFRRQTEEIREFISRKQLTSIEKLELEDAIQRGSALIGESLNREIVLEKTILQDLQLALKEGAIKLQQKSLGELEESETFLTGRPDSVFNDTKDELNDDFGNLEGIFGEPTQNIGQQVAEGLIAAGDIDEELLTEQYIKNIRAQQKAMIKLGEST